MRPVTNKLNKWLCAIEHLNVALITLTNNQSLRLSVCHNCNAWFSYGVVKHLFV